MNNELKWDSSTEFDKNQVEQKVRQLETQWQIKFPHEYIKIVLNHDAAMPFIKNKNEEWKFAGVKLPKGKQNEAIQLMSLKEKPVRELITTSIELSYNTLKEALPQKIFPFAENGSGDAILFDYRRNGEPEIVFIDHDDLITEEWLSKEDLRLKPLEAWQSEKIYPVCNSFSELVDLISPIEN